MDPAAARVGRPNGSRAGSATAAAGTDVGGRRRPSTLMRISLWRMRQTREQAGRSTAWLTVKGLDGEGSQSGTTWACSAMELPGWRPTVRKPTSTQYAPRP